VQAPEESYALPDTLKLKNKSNSTKHPVWNRIKVLSDGDNDDDRLNDNGDRLTVKYSPKRENASFMAMDDNELSFVMDGKKMSAKQKKEKTNQGRKTVQIDGDEIQLSMQNCGASEHNQQEAELNSDLPRILTFISNISSDSSKEEKLDKELMGEGISENISVKPVKPSLFSSVKVSKGNSRDSIDMILDRDKNVNSG
jgi:hypothetical protein